MFAILSKVGVYVLLRLSLLVFGSEAGALTGFGGGLPTKAFLLRLEGALSPPADLFAPG